MWSYLACGGMVSERHSNARRKTADQEPNQAPPHPPTPQPFNPKLENTDNSENKFNEHNKSTIHWALAMDALPSPNRNRPWMETNRNGSRVRLPQKASMQKPTRNGRFCQTRTWAATPSRQPRAFLRRTRTALSRSIHCCKYHICRR